MNKQEIISAIEELIDNLNDYQSTAYIGIAEEIENTTKKAEQLKEELIKADSALDECVEYLENAKELAEDLPEYEYTTTFAKMAEHISNKILCNSIYNIDEDFSPIPERQSEGEPIGEVMQYWLTDCTDNDVEWLTENYDRVYFGYSVKLQLWVLIVDHWGTSWDYVTIGTHNKHDSTE